MPLATRTRIKICGVRTPDIARAAVDAGADAIGLVFAPGTPRAVTQQEAQAVLGVLPAFVEPVGLFVNATPAGVLEVARQLGLRTVQFHGREAPGTAAATTPLRIIKALAFDSGAAGRLASWTRQDVPNLAAILWDSPPPPKSAAAQTGGHGQAFDWNALAALLAQNASSTVGTVLAGGLRPDNVAEAIRIVRPYAVDVSSGVESSKGVKDVGLIAHFCAAVRTADTGG